MQTDQQNITAFRCHLADDAFAIGTARWAREVIAAEKSVLMADNPHYLRASIAYKAALASKPETPAEMARLIGADTLATYRELCQRAAEGLLPGLGTFGLLVVADLLENPGTDRQGIAERRGLKISSVTTVLQKLDAWGLVEADQPFGGRKTYTLVGDVFGEIAERLPEARTYKIGIQRRDRQLERMQHWADREALLAELVGETERQEFAEKRRDRIANHRYVTVALLHPEFDQHEVRECVHQRLYTPPVVNAPEMPEPTELTWYRLCELTGKELLTAGELKELITLDNILNAGIDFATSPVLTEYQRGRAEQQRSVDLTVQLVNTPVQMPLVAV